MHLKCFVVSFLSPDDMSFHIPIFRFFLQIKAVSAKLILVTIGLATSVCNFSVFDFGFFHFSVYNYGFCKLVSATSVWPLSRCHPGDHPTGPSGPRSGHLGPYRCALHLDRRALRRRLYWCCSAGLHSHRTGTQQFRLFRRSRYTSQLEPNPSSTPIGWSWFQICSNSSWSFYC